MSDAPERIWAVTEPDDYSAQILGNVYAQQVPDGMVGKPVEYVRADLAREDPAPDHAEWNAAIEAAAKVAQGQYVSQSMLDPGSPLYGIDMPPDRSDWGRGIQRGREQAAAAIRAMKKG